MTNVQHRPAYLLHALVARLDVAADEMLRRDHDISYAKFLVLLAVERLGTPTQRELAAEQQVSDPAMSRTAAALAADGLLDVRTVPGNGHRRAVGLTPRGRRLVEEGSDLLESAYAALAEVAGVQADVLSRPVQSMIEALDDLAGASA